MSYGSNLDLSKSLIAQIRAFVGNAATREDQEKLLDDEQLMTPRAEDVNLFVINTEPGDQTNAVSEGHSYPLNLTPLQIRYLKDRPAAVKSISKKLRNEGFVCKFDDDFRMVDIQNNSGHSDKHAVQIIQESIVEMDFPLSADELTKMPDIDDAFSLPTQGPDDLGALVVKVGTTVKLVGMADAITEMNRSMTVSMKTFDTVTTEETKVEIIPVNENCLSYLQTQKCLATQFPGVTLTPGTSDIKVRGPSSAVDAAVKMIEEKLDRLKTEEIDLGSQMNVISIAKLARDIGKQHNCAITLSQKPKTIKASPVSLEARMHSSLSMSVSGRRRTKVRVVMNALENQKADVLVNTTNSHLDLDLSQGVSSCILRAAGSSIQTEVREAHSDGIQPGEVAVSGPGNIKTCKAIFHGSLPDYPKDVNSPNYKEQEENCFKWMVSTVFSCLIMASEKGYRTVAFPALGTGLLNYPVQHVVQLMYKAVRLYNDDKRSGPIKEVIIIIYPSTKLEVKQLFLAHRQTHKLETQHVANIDQIWEESKKYNGKNCEIRVRVDENLLQVVNSNIYEACDITEAIVVLWIERYLQRPETNPSLKCTDPNKPDWKCLSYISNLPETICVVDQTTCPGRTLIHSYCEGMTETDALVKGLKTAAAKVKCNTITIPIPFEGRMAKKPKASAQMVINAIREAKTDIHVVTLAIQENSVFTPFVTEVAAAFNNKLHEPADIDKSSVAVDLWEQTFSSKAAESTASLQTTSFDSILVIVSESEIQNRLAAQEVKLNLSTRGYTPC